MLHVLFVMSLMSCGSWCLISFNESLTVSKSGVSCSTSASVSPSSSFSDQFSSSDSLTKSLPIPKFYAVSDLFLDLASPSNGTFNFFDSTPISSGALFTPNGSAEGAETFAVSLATRNQTSVFLDSGDGRNNTEVFNSTIGILGALVHVYGIEPASDTNLSMEESLLIAEAIETRAPFVKLPSRDDGWKLVHDMSDVTLRTLNDGAVNHTKMQFQQCLGDEYSLRVMLSVAEIQKLRKLSNMSTFAVRLHQGNSTLMRVLPTEDFCNVSVSNASGTLFGTQHPSRSEDFSVFAIVGDAVPALFIEVKDSCGHDIPDVNAVMQVQPSLTNPDAAAVTIIANSATVPTEVGIGSVHLEGQIAGARFGAAKAFGSGRSIVELVNLTSTSPISNGQLNVTVWAKSVSSNDGYCHTQLIPLSVEYPNQQQVMPLDIDIPHLSSVDLANFHRRIRISCPVNIFADSARDPENVGKLVRLTSSVSELFAPRGMMYTIGAGHLHYSGLKLLVSPENVTVLNYSYNYFVDLDIYPNRLAFTHHDETVILTIDKALFASSFTVERYNVTFVVDGVAVSGEARARSWLGLVAIFGPTFNLGTVTVAATVLDCSADLDMSLDHVLHPMTVPIGSGIQKYYTGAIICNAGISFVVLIVSFAFHRFRRIHSHFPHYALRAVALLYPGTAYASVKALQERNDSLISYVLYIVIGLLILGFPAVYMLIAAQVLPQWIPRASRESENDKVASPDSNCVGSALVRLLQGFGQYKFMHIDHIRFRSVYEAYRGPVVRWSVLDVVYPLCLSMCTVAPCPQCDIALLVLIVIHCMVVMGCHPYVSVARNILVVFVDLLLCWSVVLFLRGSEPAARGSRDVAVFFASFCNIVGIVLEFWTSDWLKDHVDAAAESAEERDSCFLPALSWLQRHLQWLQVLSVIENSIAKRETPLLAVQGEENDRSESLGLHREWDVIDDGEADAAAEEMLAKESDNPVKKAVVEEKSGQEAALMDWRPFSWSDETAQPLLVVPRPTVATPAANSDRQEATLQPRFGESNDESVVLKLYLTPEGVKEVRKHLPRVYGNRSAAQMRFSGGIVMPSAAADLPTMKPKRNHVAEQLGAVTQKQLQRAE